MNVNIHLLSKHQLNNLNKDDKLNVHWLDRDWVFLMEPCSRKIFQTKACVCAVCICLTTAFEGQSVIVCDSEEKEKNKKKKRGREGRWTCCTDAFVRIYGYIFNSFLFFFSPSFCVVVHLFNEMREECISCDRNRRGKINLLLLFLTYTQMSFFPFLKN